MATLRHDSSITLYNNTAITAAISAAQTDPIKIPADVGIITFTAKFVYGADGTEADMWVQTSADGGSNWHDIVQFHFAQASLVKIASVNALLASTHATATNASLADNTIVNGYIGTQLRVSYLSTGTYSGTTTMKLTAVLKGLTTR